jgi:predicted PurR-regulated permease PerM
MTQAVSLRDPARAVFLLVFIAGLIVATFWIVHPFLPAAVWAATIVIATWPLMRRAQTLLWGRRGLAVALMSALLLLCLVVPLVIGLNAIITRLDDIVAWLQTVTTRSIPSPPEWLTGLPFVGPRLAVKWATAAAASPEELSARLSPYGRELAGWVIATVGDLGMLLVQFLLVVIFASILYASGETAAAATCRFARRLAGARGEHSARLAASAIRGVALGIVVTALVQTALAGLGLYVAGVPFALVLTAVIFMFCIAQLGPALILIGAVAWTYWNSGTGVGTALLVWSLFVSAMDNVLRPILIRRGADLPLLLVFLGVLGGLLAFGIIGLFIGPVVLAVSYSLLTDWVGTTPPAAPRHDANGELAPVSAITES